MHTRSRHGGLVLNAYGRGRGLFPQHVRIWVVRAGTFGVDAHDKACVYNQFQFLFDCSYLAHSLCKCGDRTVVCGFGPFSLQNGQMVLCDEVSIGKCVHG